MTTTAVPDPPRFGWRFRLVSCCLVLVAIAFAQRPGRLVSDTKLDLVVDPGAMLGRALHLWDPEGGFGQVQNQAYGYLFPMGPFFWVGDLLSVPGWVVQRLWWSLILVVAFLGVVKLCAALGLGTPTSRVVAGFAYALSPRILTTLGPISIEAWPSALVPWVLVPLVIGTARGSPRQAAALSAVAVAAVGGVNAAATFVVVPLGALWLLTRTPGPRRRALMTWWPLLVALGTAWWLVPLLLLGRYSPPFLDFIETSSVTTFPTSVVDVLRGTSHWVPYVDPSWQAGNDLLTTGYVVLDTGVLLLLGVAGLMLRSNPHRQFLVLALLLGLVAVTAGHGGALSGWFDEATRSALDGVLAPLRNVHKFDAWLRLPLVLGVAHLLGSITPRPTDRATDRAPDRGDRLTYLGVLVVTVVALVGSAAPALTGRLAPTEDFDQLPDYWTEAAGWLDDHTSETNGVALLVPGTSFATYQWGTPEDEPLQPLAESRWAVRNAVPLAPPGTIRMLDAVEERLVSGRPSAGLASFLQRAGVEHLVVRNDLRRDEDLPAPGLVRQALERSPGIRQVASFGPRTGGQVRLDLREDGDATGEDDDEGTGERGDDGSDGRRQLLGSGWEGRYRAVEIYAVTGPSEGTAGAARIGRPVTVVGGPEDLLRLIDAGLLADEPTVLAVDADEPSESVLLTDGLRRREANFARIRDGRSATLPAGDPGRRGAPARDYLVGDARWETVSELSGIGRLTVSGSRAFADTSGPVRPENLPFAAFDGLVDTMWDSGPVRGTERAWLEVELDEAVAVPQVSVAVGRIDQPDDQPGRAVSFRVVTDAGTSEVQRTVPGEPVTVALPGGTTTTVRVEATRDGRQLSVAELVVPGVDADRTLVMPEVPSSWGAPEGILVDAGNGQRRGCVRVGPDVRCAPDGDRRGEEPGFLDRTIRLGTGSDYSLTVNARPVAGNPLLGLVQDGLLVAAQASSSAVTDPRGSAFAAIDGDGGTSWLADPADPAPTLGVRWLGERRISGIRLGLDPQAAAAPARRIRLEFPGGSRVVELDDRGRGQFVPFRSSRLDVVVLRTGRAVSLGLDGSTTRLGAGVSELRLRGNGLLPAPPLSDVPVDVGCAFGPTVRIGSDFYPTSVVASPRQLAAGEDVPARLCGPEEVRVGSGSTRLVLGPAPAFRPLGAVLRRGDLPAPEPVPGTATPVDVSWSDTVSRHATFGASQGERVLTLPENANPGWEATLPGGDEIEPVIVDGWQQGWRVPAEASRLSVSFAPDGLYRTALLGGGALLVTLLLLALGPAATGALGRRVKDSSQDEAPALAPRRLPRSVVVAVGGVALGLVAGWVGLLVAVGVAAALTPSVVRERVPEPLLVIACSVPLGAAVGAAVLRPWGSDEGWAAVLSAPQLLALVTVAAVVACEPARRPGPTFLKRWAGRSTSR